MPYKNEDHEESAPPRGVADPQQITSGGQTGSLRKEGDMERKMYKVFGVVITLLLVFSMVAAFAVSTTPVAAGIQTWSQITMPGDKMQLLPGSDISTIAVTPDGGTLFAGVVLNQTWVGHGQEGNEGDILNQGDWHLYRSTDGGYRWKAVSGFDALGITDPIVSIKVSPNWADDGILYVATTTDVYKYKDSTKKWTDMAASDFGTIKSMDVTVDADNILTVVIGTSTSAMLYTGGAWANQNVYIYQGMTANANVLAVAFSPNYATDGAILAVVKDRTNLRLRAETDIDANNWGSYLLDSYFTYYNASTGTRLAIPAVTACIAFPDDYATTKTVFVGLNSQDSGLTVGVSGANTPGTDGYAAQHQLGDAFKVSLTSGLMATSSVTDLNIRGAGTGTDVWSMAVSGDTDSANIVCGISYVSQSGGMDSWEGQIHLSRDGGNTWSPALKPPSGMTAAVVVGGSPASQNVGSAFPVVVMSPDFANSSKAYCANGYFRGNGGVCLSGFYASTDNGATWNGRGLLDRNSGAEANPLQLAIFDIVPSTQYETDNTIYMVTADSETIVQPLTIGLLWKTVDGGKTWEIICDMIPLSTVTSTLNAVLVDKVAVAGNYVFIAGSEGVFIGTEVDAGPVDLIFRSGDDAGQTFATTIATRGPVDQLLAIDQDTLITANGSNVWLTTNAGGKWTAAKGDIPITETITDLVLKGSALIVSTDAGNVYLCDNYVSDFTFYQVGTKAVGNASAGDFVVLAFDNNYDTDHTIYAGVSGFGATGTKAGIWRNVDNSNTWDRLAFNVSPYTNYSAVNSNVSAIACDNNGILWAICSATNTSINASDIPGIAIRSVNPTESAVSKVHFDAVTAGLAKTDSIYYDLNVVGSTEAFAVGGAFFNELWIYTDTLIKPTLISPANLASSYGDLLAGTSFARVELTWTYLDKADSFQYQVARDPKFLNIATDSTPALVNGTTTGTALDVQLYAGTQYYWRVRVATGLNSQWSDVWSFTTPLGPSAEAPTLTSPAAGQVNVSTQPVLSWSGIANANKYELVVAKNCDWANPILNLVGTSAISETAYQLTGLTNGTNYCWKVRAIGAGTNSSWSNMGSFTTVTTQVPAKEENTPPYVWVIIALSAVLLVSVVILIIRTRRA